MRTASTTPIPRVTAARTHTTRRARTTKTRAMINVTRDAACDSTIFALDFDGVVCDSVGESSLSAWKHGLELWPEVFGAPGAEAEKPRVLDELRRVRPVVETGYENTTLARALLEKLPGYGVDEILNDWDGMSGGLMTMWGDRKSVV